MGKRIKGIVGVCLLVILTGGISISVVATQTTKQQIEQKQNEKKQTEEELQNTQKEIEGLKGTQGTLKTELKNLNHDLAEVSDNLAQLEEDIEEKEAEIMQTEIELQEAIETEDAQYESMKARIRFVYECGEMLYTDLLLSSKGFGDFLNKADYFEQMSAYDRKMLDNYTQVRKNTEEKRSELYQKQAELQTLKENVEEQKANVEAKVSKTSSNIAKYADDISEAEKEALAYEEKIKEQEADLVALRKKYEEELAMSKLAAMSARRDISEVVFDEGDRYLLANLIYCEAGGEPYEGQVAVGAVVINRVLSSVYPDTVVGVIYQNRQFEPVTTGRMAIALAANKATANCYRAADEAMSGVTNVGNCVYFRTPIEGLTGIRIGGHIFY